LFCNNIVKSAKWFPAPNGIEFDDSTMFKLTYAPKGGAESLLFCRRPDPLSLVLSANKPKLLRFHISSGNFRASLRGRVLLTNSFPGNAGKHQSNIVKPNSMLIWAIRAISDDEVRRHKQIETPVGERA
jgi:hypothetical protein